MTFSCCSGTWDRRPPPSSGTMKLLPAGSALNLGGGSAARVRYWGNPRADCRSVGPCQGRATPSSVRHGLPEWGSPDGQRAPAGGPPTPPAAHRQPSSTRHQDQGSSLAPSALVGVRVVVPDLKGSR